MYGEGISKMGELLDLGVTAGIVEKSGAWFSFESERLGQGRENSKTFLRENPEVSQKIEKMIRQNAGLLSDEMMTGPDSPEDAEAAEEGGEEAAVE